MKYQFIKSLIVFIISYTVQSQDKKTISDYVYSCKNTEITVNSIKHKYLCEIENNTENKNEITKIINESILHLRNELQSKDISKLTILNAKEDTELQKKFLEQDFSKIFVLKEGSKVIQYFLMENNRIISLNTLNKGGLRSFMILCN